MAIPSFVDRVTLRVQGGNGGNGCASVHREKFKPLGGPDGGNGGNGGSVVLRVDPGLTTLVDYHRQSVRRAEHGRAGKGRHANGAAGADVVLAVPQGTVVSDAETGEVLADLADETGEVVIASGGKGGLGNAALASAARKAPGFALLGEDGEDRTIVLELKVVADVGLVGFPSAGKSSLIAAVSRARPEVADYPFTTLVPHLGVVVAGDTTYTVADVPGLIEGASAGRGLGHEFLRHVERCSALVHVLDCATYEPGRDPLTDLDVIEAELAAYDRSLAAVPDGPPPLGERPRLVVLNKIDIPDAADLADIVRPDLEARGLRVFPVSTKSGEGLQPLIFALAALVREVRAAAPARRRARVVLRPAPAARRAGTEFTVDRQHDDAGEVLWRVHGTKPERWVRQTDFGNDEAVGFLADRFYRLGIEDRLLALGAEPGDAVAIGHGEHPVVFDFAPQVEVGAHTLADDQAEETRVTAPPERILSRRGEDHRLQTPRQAVLRRRALDAAYHAERAGDDASEEDAGEADDR